MDKIIDLCERLISNISKKQLTMVCDITKDDGNFEIYRHSEIVKKTVSDYLKLIKER